MMRRRWASVSVSIVLSFWAMLSFGASRTLKELPNMSINSFAQDSTGYMWIATDNGLCRYNGSNYVQYYNDPGDPLSIPSSKVFSIVTDPDGVIWAATDKGLCYYNHLTDAFVRVKTGVLLTGLEVFSDNVYYYGNGGIISLNPRTKKIVQAETSQAFSISLLKACSDSTLLACRSDGRQIARLDRFLNLQTSVIMSQAAVFNSVDEDWYGNIWLGRGDGLHILDRQNLMPVEDPVSLAAIREVGRRNVTIVLRNGERMYVCSPGKGVMSFFSTPDRTEKITSVTATWFGLNYTSDFSAAISDSDGFPWIGTKDRGFGVRFYTKKNFKRDPFWKIFTGKYVNASSTDGNVIWFGSYYKGILGYDLALKKYKWYSNDDKFFTSSIGSVRGITSLLIDSESRLWLSSSGRILRCGTDRQYLKSVDVSYEGQDAHCFLEQPPGQVWAGTDNGLICICGPNAGTVLFSGSSVTALARRNSDMVVQVDGLGPHIVDSRICGVAKLPLQEEYSEPLLHVNAILEGSNGRLWFGTSYDGIYGFDYDEDSHSIAGVCSYSVEDGLGSNEISALLEDEEGNVWITSSYGISLFSDRFGQIVTYYPSPWLDVQQFCKGCIAMANGYIIAGGNIGAAAFSPKEIVYNTQNDRPVKLVLTGLRINGVNQKPGKRGSVLKKPLSNTSKLVLKHNQNNLELEYEAISFILKNNVNFAYRLEGRGMNDRWTEVGSNSYANFPNLSPGSYVFQLVSKDQSGVMEGTLQSLSIRVKASPWKSWYSFLVYILLVAGLSVSVVFIIIRIKTEKLEMEAVKDELDREKNMAQMKQTFFSNISHELRNSLSLIYGPVKMLKDVKDKEKIDSLVESINISTKRLVSLTDMTLGLSRIENGALPLTVTQTPIVQLVRNVMTSFTPLASKKQIAVSLVTGMDEKTLLVLDSDKLVTILSNLLSNALKYTPDGGNVQIRLATDNVLPERLADAKPSSEYLFVTVNDDGIGMKEEETKLIFDRYVRLDDASRSVSGAGIGLHYVKQLLKVHGGTIAASLREEGGMSFFFAVPVDPSLYDVVNDYRSVSNIVDGIEALDVETYISFEKEESRTSEEITGPHKPVVLFVEDNLQLLKYCCDTFSGKYQVHWASNGLEGLELVGDLMPDIVVTDINMPQMNGYELCSKIKCDPLLSHISVVMLTAKVDEKDKIEGYRSGADVYVTKPFDASLLMAVIDNILAAKQKMKEYFVSQSDGTQDDGSDDWAGKLNNADKAFIEKLRRFIDSNLSDTEIDINVLSAEMNLSRSSLFRKMKSMTGKTPKDFILAYKLNKAAEYIKEGSYRINEISDLLGFSSPSHFSKVFKQRFGVSPKAFSTRNDTD